MPPRPEQGGGRGAGGGHLLPLRAEEEGLALKVHRVPGGRAGHGVHEEPEQAGEGPQVRRVAS